MLVWREELDREGTRITVGKPTKPQSEGLEGDRSLGFCSRGNERLWMVLEQRNGLITQSHLRHVNLAVGRRQYTTSEVALCKGQRG